MPCRCVRGRGFDSRRLHHWLETSVSSIGIEGRAAIGELHRLHTRVTLLVHMEHAWASRRAFILCSVGVGIAAAAASAASGASGRHAECESAAQASGPTNVCYGTIPPVRTRVVLTSRNGSHEHGVAWIKFGLHETSVVIRLKGAPAGVSLPAHLRVGGCWGGGVVYSLGNVVNGRRVARIDSVPGFAGFSIVIRASIPAERAAVVACGVIPRR
jgi:hypothetical protein